MQPWNPKTPSFPGPELQVGLEKIATEDTRLVYMTTGVLLQKVVSAKSLTEFTHIFIDEVGAPAPVLGSQPGPQEEAVP